MNLKEPSLLTLILLVALGPVGAVLYTPALPAMGDFFGVDAGRINETMTSYLLGYAIGQLPYGAISHRWGRRKALSWALSLEIVGALLCALSGFWGGVWLLIGARFLLALGASAGLILSFALIRESFSAQKAAHVFAAIMVAFALAPGLATTMGGVLVEYLNWQSCFYFLAIYGVILLFLCRRLPETLFYAELLGFVAAIKSFWQTVKNYRLVLSAALMGCATSIVYVFASQAPFLAINVLKASPIKYGLLNLIPSFGVMWGSLFSARLTRYLPPIKGVALGIMVAGCYTLLFAATFALGWVNFWTLFGFIPMIYLGLTLIYANASLMAMQSAVGRGEGLMSFLNIGLSVFAVLAVSLLDPHQAWVMPVIFLVLLAIMLLLWVAIIAKKRGNS